MTTYTPFIVGIVIVLVMIFLYFIFRKKSTSSKNVNCSVGDWSTCVADPTLCNKAGSDGYAPMKIYGTQTRSIVNKPNNNGSKCPPLSQSCDYSCETCVEAEKNNPKYGPYKYIPTGYQTNPPMDLCRADPIIDPSGHFDAPDGCWRDVGGDEGIYFLDQSGGQSSKIPCARK